MTLDGATCVKVNMVTLVRTFNDWVTHCYEAWIDLLRILADAARTIRNNKLKH